MGGSRFGPRESPYDSAMPRVGLVFLFASAVALSAPAFAHEGHEHGPVVVAEVEGPLDQRMMDFLVEVVEQSDAQVIVFRIDSPGMASGDPDRLFAAVEAATVPIVAWVGPQGARAYGGSLQLGAATDYFGGAPGARVGYAVPTIAGDSMSVAMVDDPSLESLADRRLEVTEFGPWPATIAGISPSIGQFIASLDGMELNGAMVETANQVDLADGSAITISSVEVRFLKPGTLTRFLRLAIRPEAAFFFLVAGLALVVFEFYAAGVGVTAAVASVSLFLAAYGLAVLPVRWVSVAAAVAGLLLYTWDFQHNLLSWRTVLGTAGLVAGGLFITDADPQFRARWWTVLVVVFGVGLFYLFAMTTVVRSRFSTPTIGREHLIGRPGVAESSFDPNGIVLVDGARWSGRAHRAAGIDQGDPVTVLAVEGIVLEVGPDDRSVRESGSE